MSPNESLKEVTEERTMERSNSQPADFQNFEFNKIKVGSLNSILNSPINLKNDLLVNKSSLKNS